MKMAKVQKCSAEECAYNKDGMCHTLGITIGDIEQHPRCDTYCDFEDKGGNIEAAAGVGACKVSACEYNQDLECTASQIEVGMQQNEIDCLTFEKK